jgi:hypothetical protein
MAEGVVTFAAFFAGCNINTSMLDQVLAPLVVKTRRQSTHQSDRAIRRPQ